MKTRTALIIVAVAMGSMLVSSPTQAGGWNITIGDDDFYFSVGHYDYFGYQGRAYATSGPVHMSWDVALDGYGRWIDYPSYGRCFVPYVSNGWRPYSRGRWVHTIHGWNWVSYDPFGWAVHHYGNWFYDPYYGWVWVPGYEWSPARVHFTVHNGYIGWVPMFPAGFTRPAYGYYAHMFPYHLFIPGYIPAWSYGRGHDRYYNGYRHSRRDYYDGYHDGYYDSGYGRGGYGRGGYGDYGGYSDNYHRSYWTFVPANRFQELELYEYTLFGSSATRFVEKTYVDPIAGGLSAKAVERYSGRRVSTVPVKTQKVVLGGKAARHATPVGLEKAVRSHAEKTMKAETAPALKKSARVNPSAGKVERSAKVAKPGKSSDTEKSARVLTRGAPAQKSAPPRSEQSVAKSRTRSTLDKRSMEDKRSTRDSRAKTARSTVNRTAPERSKAGSSKDRGRTQSAQTRKFDNVRSEKSVSQTRTRSKPVDRSRSSVDSRSRSATRSIDRSAPARSKAAPRTQRSVISGSTKNRTPAKSVSRSTATSKPKSERAQATEPARSRSSAASNGSRTESEPKQGKVTTKEATSERMSNSKKAVDKSSSSRKTVKKGTRDGKSGKGKVGARSKR